MADEYENLRERLTLPVPPPPPGLAAEIKNQIPDLASSTPADASLSDHPALWKLAASVLMIFGFTYIAARMFLAAREEQQFAARMQEPPAAVARSASDEKLADGALAEPPQDSAVFADRSGYASPAAIPRPMSPPRPLAARSPRREKSETTAVRERATVADTASSNDDGAEKARRDTSGVQAEDTAAAEEIAMAAPPAASAPAPASVAPVMAETVTQDGAAAPPATASQRASRFGNQQTKAVAEPLRTTCVEPRVEGDRSGVVVVRFTIAAEGSVNDVNVLKGVSKEIDAAVTDAVKQWKYARGDAATTIEVGVPFGNSGACSSTNRPSHP